MFVDDFYKLAKDAFPISTNLPEDVKEILTTEYKPLIIESEVKTMDEKIIEILSAIQNDLSLVKSEISEMKSEMSEMKSEMSEMKSEIELIKEDTEITRSAVNSLCEWAEAASEVIGVRFPVE